MTAPLAYVTVSAETEAIRRGARVRFQPVRDSLAFVVLSALFSSCALALWNAFATQAFNNLALRPGMKRLLAGAFFFRHQPCIDRLIFLSVPHRGSRLAAGILGSIGNRLIRRSKELAQVIRELHTRYPGLLQPYYARQSAQRAPTSLISLVSNPLLDSLAALPIWVPFYSIIGDRGFGGGTHSSNGVVPYSSSHLNGAESEKIAPAGHEVFTDEAAVAEGSAGKSDETEAWPGSHQKQKKQSSVQSGSWNLANRNFTSLDALRTSPVGPHPPGIVNLLARASLT